MSVTGRVVCAKFGTEGIIVAGAGQAGRSRAEYVVRREGDLPPEPSRPMTDAAFWMILVISTVLSHRSISIVPRGY